MDKYDSFSPSGKFAYLDEFGAFGFNFDSNGCTSHFIVSAVIVDEKKTNKRLKMAQRKLEKNISRQEK